MKFKDLMTPERVSNIKSLMYPKSTGTNLIDGFGNNKIPKDYLYNLPEDNDSLDDYLMDDMVENDMAEDKNEFEYLFVK